MVIVTMHKAKTELSKLVARAEAGEEVVISRAGKPAVKLVPAEQPGKPIRKPGALKHLLGKIPDSFFFDPLPEDELAAWEGKYSFDPDKAERSE
jgi:prevent-host-death family protein